MCCTVHNDNKVLSQTLFWLTVSVDICIHEMCMFNFHVCVIRQLDHTPVVRLKTAVQSSQHNFSVGHSVFNVKDYGKKTNQQDLKPLGQTPET